jgi:hypothetical protein
MSIASKLLPTLALAVALSPAAMVAYAAPVAAQVPHDAVLKAAQDCWATNFGFLPTNCDPPVCHDVQKGFWPRPQRCVR